MVVIATVGISQAFACKPPVDNLIGPAQSKTVSHTAAIPVLDVSETEARIYSKRDLNGRYASLATATIFDPTSNRTTNATCVGVVTFDGRGHFTDKEVHSYDGFIVRDEFVGTYTINADGRGLMHFIGENETFDYEFVVSNDAKEITFLILLDIPGVVSNGTLKKQ